MTFRNLFKNQKPLIGMIHTKTPVYGTALELARSEIELYLRYGIYPLVENYFGSAADCEEILAWLHCNHPDAIYGVNILGDYREAFRLANLYGASFIQIDSVCGHLPLAADKEYAEQLAELRAGSAAIVLGGVRFKYQAVRSGRSLEEDLRLGAQRCDAIVCTGEGTGLPTPFGKVGEFKAVLPDFPIVVGAGVTLDTVEETFRLGDGAIVGSWLKDGHHDHGDVNEEYVSQMTDQLAYDKADCYYISKDWFTDTFGEEKMSEFLRQSNPRFEKDVVIRPWMPELGGCAVSIMFDRLLYNLDNLKDWFICIICEHHHYINLATVEQMSSGVHFRRIVNAPDGCSAVIYSISTDFTKDEIEVLSDPFVGYLSHRCYNKDEITTSTVPVGRTFQGWFVLNFTVSGEFNAGVFMFNPHTKEIKNLYYHLFCCK